MKAKKTLSEKPPFSQSENQATLLVELKALRAFKEKAQLFADASQQFQGAIYAAMIGMRTAQLDQAAPFEVYTDLRNCYADSLRTILRAMRAEIESFDFDLQAVNMIASGNGKAKHDDANGDLFTEDEIAAALRVSLDTLRAWRKHGPEA